MLEKTIQREIEETLITIIKKFTSIENRQFGNVDILELCQHGYFEIILTKLTKVKPEKSGYKRRKETFENFKEKISKIDYLLVHSNQYIKKDNKIYSQLEKVFSLSFKEKYLMLEEYDTERGFDISNIYTNFYFNNLYFNFPKDINLLITELSDIYNINIREFQVYTINSYKRFLTQYINYSTIFKKNNIKEIFIFGAHWNKGIIAAAKNQKVNVTEIQYAHFNNTHLAFNYWHPSQFYPDRILLWDKMYNLSNLYYTRNIVKQYNNIMVNTLKFSVSQNILIISQWVYREELLNLYNNIKGTNIYLLVHPKDTFTYPCDKNIIKSLDNQKELEKAKLVIGYNSSMLVNAKSLGIEVLTFDRNFSSQCDVKYEDISNFKLPESNLKKSNQRENHIEPIIPLIKKKVEKKQKIVVPWNFLAVLPLLIDKNKSQPILQEEIESKNDNEKYSINQELYFKVKGCSYKKIEKLCSYKIDIKILKNDIKVENTVYYDFKLEAQNLINRQDDEINKYKQWIKAKDDEINKYKQWIKAKDYWLNKKDNEINKYKQWIKAKDYWLNKKDDEINRYKNNKFISVYIKIKKIIIKILKMRNNKK